MVFVNDNFYFWIGYFSTKGKVATLQECKEIAAEVSTSGELPAAQSHKLWDFSMVFSPERELPPGWKGGPQSGNFPHWGTSQKQCSSKSKGVDGITHGHS